MNEDYGKEMPGSVQKCTSSLEEATAVAMHCISQMGISGEHVTGARCLRNIQAATKNL